MTQVQGVKGSVCGLVFKNKYIWTSQKDLKQKSFLSPLLYTTREEQSAEKAADKVKQSCSVLES